MGNKKVKHEEGESGFDKIIQPKNPKKLEDILPHGFNILKDDAKLGKDANGQYFIRFPKKIAEALHLETVEKIEFNVKTPLPDGDPKKSELFVSMKRK